MKKLILILFLLVLSNTLSSQNQPNYDQFKDYKACSECFEQWDNSNNKTPKNEDYTQASKNHNSNSTLEPAKNESRKLIARIVSLTVGVFTMAYLAKVTNAVQTQ